MKEPVIMVMTGRSGSSMVAGIFSKHGLWTGPDRAANSNNPKGFFENRPLINEMRHWAGGDCFNWVPDFRTGWKAEVERIITSQGNHDREWLFKMGATFYPLFAEFKPKWVKIWRDPDNILKSNRRAGFLRKFDDHELLGIIALHHELMEEIDGFDIDTQLLINGNDSQLKTAIEGCGLVYDPNITDEFIDRSYWHYA